MADDMRDNKDTDKAKLEASDIELTSSSPILSKLDNFWYYHKWKVIIILFFAIVFVVGIVQIVNKDESDEAVIIAVPEYLYAEDIEGLNSVLSSLIPNTDGDAKKVDLFIYSIYSENEMEAANTEETDEEGKYIVQVTNSYNVSQVEQYRSYLQTGEVSLLFVSPYLYGELRENDRLRPLSDTFGEALPESAMSDGYGIRLGDTYLYEFFDELKVLPADTVICLSRAYIWGASSDAERYAETVEYYKSLVNFGK